jgi:hypothetical protein
MPGIPVLLARIHRSAPPGSQVELPEHAHLFLPSEAYEELPCSSSLMSYEFRLRHAQSQDALNELRNHLRIRTYMYQKKKKNSRGVASNTRAQASIKRQEEKVDASARKYRVARKALVALAGPLGQVGWEATVPPLSPEDVKGMHVSNDDPATKGRKVKAKSGKGVQQLSWIWRDLSAIAQAVEDPGLNDGELDDTYLSCMHSSHCSPALRIEWCKARARAMRWSEDVTLLLEEMRRVTEFFEWQAAWWRAQAARHKGLPLAELSGMRAYALRQANLRESLLQGCRDRWASVPKLFESSSRHLEVACVSPPLPAIFESLQPVAL